MEEMAELHAQGYDTVIMADEHFMANRKRVLSIMDELKRLLDEARIKYDLKLCLEREFNHAPNTPPTCFGVSRGS